MPGCKSRLLQNRYFYSPDRYAPAVRIITQSGDNLNPVCNPKYSNVIYVPESAKGLEMLNFNQGNCPADVEDVYLQKLARYSRQSKWANQSFDRFAHFLVFTDD